PAPDGRGPRRMVLAAGAFLGLHCGLWLTSLEFTTVASSVTLVTMSPIFVALGARRWLGEQVTTRTWAGMAVALAGAVAIGLADGIDVDLGARALVGDLLALAGAVAVAGYLLVGRAARQSVPLAWYASRTYGVAAATLLVACLVSGTPLWGFEAMGWLAIAGIVAGPQLLGHTVLNGLLDRVRPTTISIAVLAEPVGATLLAWALLDELPATLFWLGAPLVLIGIAFATVVRRQRAPVD
ncbi:MAG: DMT family transporter, partial [Nitriliruptorales bacterium]|nr:DMT family transporter [Nitriliruptorales bacterium]